MARSNSKLLFPSSWTNDEIKSQPLDERLSNTSWIFQLLLYILFFIFYILLFFIAIFIIYCVTSHNQSVTESYMQITNFTWIKIVTDQKYWFQNAFFSKNNWCCLKLLLFSIPVAILVLSLYFTSYFASLSAFSTKNRSKEGFA